MADFARAASVSQLRRTLRSYSFEETEPDPVERHDPTHVTGLFDDSGRYRLHALLDPDDGAIVDSALREARDALFRAGAVDVTWCDALVEMACRSLGGATPIGRRDAFVAYFHVHTDRPGAYLHHGPALPDSPPPSAAVRRSRRRGRVARGRPVDVGRTRRIVPGPHPPHRRGPRSRLPSTRLWSPPRRDPPHHPLARRRTHQHLEPGRRCAPTTTGCTTAGSSTSPATPTSPTGSSSPTGAAEPWSRPHRHHPTRPAPSPSPATGSTPPASGSSPSGSSSAPPPTPSSRTG